MPSVVMTLDLPRITAVRITEDALSVDLEGRRTISVPLMWYPRLTHATPEERQRFEIVGAGYGIHWPDLDEDVSVEGLLAGKRSTESPRSWERWLKARKRGPKPHSR